MGISTPCYPPGNQHIRLGEKDMLVPRRVIYIYIHILGGGPFQVFFIFTSIWGRFIFQMVETTSFFVCSVLAGQPGRGGVQMESHEL